MIFYYVVFGASIRYILKKLASEGKTIILVTHDISFAASTATRVLFLNEEKILENEESEKFFKSPTGEALRSFLAKGDVLELLLEDEEFDFSNAVESIWRFFQNQGNSAGLMWRAISAFEELVIIGLLPHIGSTGPIRVCFSRREDEIMITASYGGATYNPLSAMEQPSLDILRHQADKISFSENKDNAERNRLKIEIQL